MGIELYSTDLPGVGGRLKKHFEAFVVEEIAPDGRVLELQPWTDRYDCVISGEQSKHIRFTLQKRGLSTFDVTAILAAELKIPQHLVGYAGLKDKRAVTVQAMSVPARCAGMLATMHLSNIRIRDPTYSGRPVRTGDLWGNRFTIRLGESPSVCGDDDIRQLSLLDARATG